MYIDIYPCKKNLGQIHAFESSNPTLSDQVIFKDTINVNHFT